MYKVKVLDINNKSYPKQLLKIKNKPKQLYVIGDETILNNKSIAIVGARDATEYGIKSTEIFTKSLISAGLTVVSGLALGIDTEAHRNSNGNTIAVIASGFKNIYPKENNELVKEIVNKGVCIISEYPPETQIDLSKFPSRNRIIAGLSLGVLVIEAKYRSGSSITARYAKEQNKPVFCIPNNINEKTGVGTNNLIKKGAKLITKEKDILNELNIQVKQKSKIEYDTKKNIPKQYKIIYDVIKNRPENINNIAIKTKLSILQVNQILTMMEIDDLIKQLPGNEYIIK